MKRRAIFVYLPAAVSCLLASQAGADTFTGTNQPGASSDFSFNVAAGATNLSIVLSNSTPAWSHLFLKRGGAASDTDYDFASRLTSATNAINIEAPDLLGGTNFGLHVLTPSNSIADAFAVSTATNLAGLRSVYPVLKPVVFSTPGSLATNASGSGNYFQVDIPTNLVVELDDAYEHSSGHQHHPVR